MISVKPSPRTLIVLPRFIRLRDAPSYFGKDKNRFNHDVRPHICAIPIDTRGIAFDRVDLDGWADEYRSRNGRPAASLTSSKPWETKERQVCVPERRAKRLIGERGITRRCAPRPFGVALRASAIAAARRRRRTRLVVCRGFDRLT